MFDTKHYTVQQLQDDPDDYCWAVINKQYNSYEHKSYTLPGAVAVCRALSEQMDDVLADRPTLSVVGNETLN